MKSSILKLNKIYSIDTSFQTKPSTGILIQADGVNLYEKCLGCCVGGSFLGSKNIR